MKSCTRIILALFSAALVAVAEPADDDGRQGPDAPAYRRPDGPLERLRQHDPERYAELMKLRETDPQAFRQQIREILRGRVGDRHERMGGPGAGGPAGGGLFEADETELSERLFRRGLHDRFMDKLERDEPETWQRLDKLRQEDPDAFREQLRGVFEEKVRRFRGTAETDGAQIHGLASKYHRTEDPAQKEEIRTQLREQLARQFDRHMEQRAKIIADLERRLDEARRALAEREAARDRLVDEQLEDVLAGRWRRGGASAPGGQRPWPKDRRE